MPSNRKQPRNAVSFSSFRRLHLATFQDLRSVFCNLEDVPVDAALIVYAIELALTEGRFADCISLSASLAEQQYGDARSYRLGAQIVALVKKVPFKDPSLDPKAAAIAKFKSAEDDGRLVNVELRKLFNLLEGRCDASYEIADDAQRIVRVISRARTHMRRVLGGKPPLSRIWSKCRLGGGSSVGVHGDSTHLMRKLSQSEWTVSPAAVSYVRAAAMATPCFWDALGLDATSAMPLYADPMNFYARRGPFIAPRVDEARASFVKAFDSRVLHVDYDLINCVPKNADCDRTVGSQPMLNMFVQLGVGDYLQEVLRDRCNIDLSTAQTLVNGPLALLGSSCEGMPFATIDLRSASDCLYVMLARLMLPDEWFQLTNAIRTPSYRRQD
jgi:hypothetical protein